MAARVPLVIGADGIAQQLQPADSVTAAALGFSSGSNANGKWRKEPDGQIEQRGEVTLTAGLATITFPIQFTATDIHVDLTPVLASSTTADPSTYLTAEPTLAAAAIGGSTTTVGLNAAVAAASFKVRWRATGS